jgi:hypothetical protein
MTVAYSNVKQICRSPTASMQSSESSYHFGVFVCSSWAHSVAHGNRVQKIHNHHKIPSHSYTFTCHLLHKPYGALCSPFIFRPQESFFINHLSPSPSSCHNHSQHHSPPSLAQPHHALSQTTHLHHRTRQLPHQSPRIRQRLRRWPRHQLHRCPQRRSKLQHPPHLSRLHRTRPSHVRIHGWPIPMQSQQTRSSSSCHGRQG